ncbi:hypothetical protein OU995_11860 [Roseateles sp. SL47]|uniref:hypothetical protein n=1 Tax=Roseateles sp. SL47 TaxID=2995138 RepID=UPI002271AE9D|nr:hypothetical protein [Roseateles sp. SL47]WAC75344.1 hypothetical protein OU995_11860 [Roseateles sp. SL47]
MRKRSSYRPRGVNPKAHVMAMQGAMKLGRDDQLIIAGRVAGAVDAAGQGVATQEQWGHIFDALNMIEALAHLGLVRDSAEFIQAHQTNIVQVLNRKKASGSATLHSEELKQLRDLSATWAEALAVVTHNEFFQAQERVIRKTINAANDPHVTVMEAA